MLKKNSSIQSQFLNKIIFIVLISIGLWCLSWIQIEYSTFKSHSDSLRAEFIQSQKFMLKKEVTRVVENIHNMKRQAEEKLESELKKRVYEAHQIAMNIYQQNINSKNILEIKKMIKDALRPIRFYDGRGYYFAVSMDGIEQLYPVKPEFEGENLINLQDSKNKFIIQDEIKTVKEYGEGFVKSYWVKPDKNPALQFPKLTFVKYFKPLEWYFGTGDYLDDFEIKIKKELLNQIVNLRFGAKGYFFGSTYQGDSLFSNGKITVGSGNIWDLSDPNGVKIIQEQRKAVENPEGGFVYYSWNKLGSTDLFPKVSFVKGVPEWEWTIGGGVYLDTIEKTILANRSELNNQLKKNIIRSTFILTLLLCLVYFWSKSIAHNIQKTIETFTHFLEKTSTDLTTINTDEIQLTEFKKIAVSTNKMLAGRKQAENALIKSEEKYRLLIENQKDMVVKFDPKGRLQFVSPSYCSTFGKTQSQLLGKRFMPMIHEEDQKAVADAIATVFKPPYSVQIEQRAMTKTGWRWQEWQNTAILNKENEIETIMAVGRDIDDRKKAQTALKKSEKQYQTLFNSITDLIYTQNIKGCFTSVNPAMPKLFGYSMDELVGHNAAEFMEPEMQSGFESRYIEVLKKKGYHEGVACYFSKKKEKIYLEYKSSLVKQDGDEPYINGIARDITGKILSEERVKKLQKQVVQAQKMESIGTLAGGIAHDFNNILFPIIGHTEMLIEDVPEDSPFKDSLDQILTAALRGGKLIKQILTFSRQKSGELQLTRIQPVIKEALKLIRSTIPATIEINQNINDDCGAINADLTQTHQLIINFATNAYHAMEETGGRLNISLEEVTLEKTDPIDPTLTPGVYVCIIISDTGKGMGKELIENIFDPFFTTKEVGKGTGMGLSVVHGIVKNMQGAITVYSEPDKGTEFKIYFPVEKSSDAEQNIQTNENIPTGTEHILLVDDDEAVLTLETKILERLEYKVTAKSSSIETLKIFKENPDKFDMVITDMSMPKMAGDKLATELKKINSDIPILICSGFSETISQEKAESLGINGFLLKPIVMRDLAKKIREVLNKH